MSELMYNETPILGLFETSLKCGFIFPILLKNGTPTYIGGVPAFNDCRGENTALKLMEQKDFVCWAIDPWTSEINMKIII